MTWQEKYKRALVNAVIRLGTPVADQDTYYGWIAYDYEAKRAALSQATIDYAATEVYESSWSEFMGTFWTGTDTKHGVDAKIVTDSGVFHWRYEGSMGQLILNVVN